MKRDRPDLSDLYANNVRRDAWRAQLLHEEMAEKSAKRRAAAAMRWAIVAGIVLGVAGSVAMHV
jgi:hypothetical protein